MLRKYFCVPLCLLIALALLCGCSNTISEEMPVVVNTTTFSQPFEISQDSILEKNSSENDNSLLQFNSATFGNNGSSLSQKELDIETRLFLQDVFTELPSLETHFFSARLPEQLVSMVEFYGVCNLVTKTHAYTIDNVTELKFDEIRFELDFDDYTICATVNNSTLLRNAKLFYDTGKFYLQGIDNKSKLLMQYCIDTGTITYLGNVNTIFKDNPYIVLKFPNYTLIEKKKSEVYAFVNANNEEVLKFKAKIAPSKITAYQPFIDSNNNLILINMVNSNTLLNIQSKPEVMKVESDVRHAFNTNVFIHPNDSSSYMAKLYKKCDGTYFLYGRKLLITNSSINDADFSYYYYFNSNTLDESFKNIYLFMDEYNRVFLHMDFTFDNQETGIDEFVCSIPIEKKYDEKIKTILNTQFLFSEQDEKINELLEYIS